MAALANLKTFWALNSTLNNAIPSSRLFLDYVPPGTSFPYVRVTVLGSVPTLTTNDIHIESFNYQLGIFHTNLDTLAGLVDTVVGVLDNAQITAGSLTNLRRSLLYTGEVVNGAYTYQAVLEYDWQYNSTGA